MQGNNNQNT